MKVLRHEEFDGDFKRLVDEAPDSAMMLRCINKAFHEILKDPKHAQECEYSPLLKYRKKRFFSIERPPRRAKPDMRMIYQYDEEWDEIRLFGVGYRIHDSKEDIYQILKNRHQDWDQFRED